MTEPTRRILLDTHIALWMFTESPKLPPALRTLVKQPGIEWIFHQVSTWEIQIKHQLGRLPLPQAPKDFLKGTVKETGLRYAEIEDEAIFMLGKLPDFHRDPFDRLLIAHAVVHGWEVATVDEQVLRYPIRTISLA